jgi:mannosyltransferase
MADSRPTRAIRAVLQAVRPAGPVAAATALAAVLSLLCISRKSVWVDETFSIACSSNWFDMWHELLHYEANMWFYYILLHFWLKLGDGEAFVRSFSALFAVTTVPILYFLGRRLFDRRAGALGALLLAVNPFFIQYAQEARCYALVVCLVTLASYLFVLAIERRSLILWAVWAVCTALGIYTHFFASLVCLVQLLSLPLLGRPRFPWRGVTISLALLALLLLPLFLLEPLGSGQIDWIPRPRSWLAIPGCYRRITSGLPLLVFYALSGVVATVLGARRSAPETYPPARWGYWYVAAWALLPVLIAYVFSLTVKPIFRARYLIIIVPALALLGGLCLAKLSRAWLRYLAVAAVLCLSGRSLYGYYMGHGRENWRGASAWALARAQPGDAAIFHWYTGRESFRYYFNRAGPHAPQMVLLDLTTQAENRDNPRYQLDPQRLQRVPDQYRRVWLFLRYHVDAPGRLAILNTLQTHYRCVSIKDFQSIRVYLFEKSAPRDATSGGEHTDFLSTSAGGEAP